MASVPYFTLGGEGKASKKVQPAGNDKMVSAYTGKTIGSGPVKYGTRCDAPPGHPNYGKDYHGGIRHPNSKSTFVLHFRD